MKRRDFLQSGLAATAGAGLSNFEQIEDQLAPKQEIYEWRRYSLTRGGRIRQLNAYMEKALIPALNRMGVGNVGAFTEMGSHEPAQVHVIIPYPSMSAYAKSRARLAADKTYQQAKKEYDAIKVSAPVYTRFDSTILLAFEGMPKLKAPGKGERIFELRTYEGYSEDAVARKVDMFNNGEIDVFLKTNLTPVFFGEAISGKDLPYLTYMLTFKDEQERGESWQKFIAHPDWKAMSGDPKYANTVSKIHKRMLLPLPYSQV